jgi:hypothetical protein
MTVLACAFSATHALGLEKISTPSIWGQVVLHDRLTVPTMEVLLNNGEFRCLTEGNGSFAFYGLAEGKFIK